MTVSIKAINKKATQNTEKMALTALAQKGMALAKVCQDFAMGILAEEEKRGNKQKAICKSISELTPEGHRAFRNELQLELDLSSSLAKAGQVTTTDMQGYSMGSFRTMMSNYKSISIACEMGLKTIDDSGDVKPWSLMLKQAVEYKHAQAANAPEGTIKAGRGRKSKVVTALDTAQSAMNKLSDADFVKFAAIVNAKLATMKASQSSKKAAIKKVALV